MTDAASRRSLLAAGVLLLLFVAWAARGALRAEGFLEADEVNHWLYARHAPANPTNLLHPWARPLYTLLLLPFAQLGIGASRMLSVAAAAAAAWFAVLACRALGWRTAACAVPAIFAQPLFFQQTSGIWTEVVFAAFLGAWILALAKGRPWALAAIAAAMPLVRPEGSLIVLATILVAFSGSLRAEGAWRPVRLAPLLVLPCGMILWWALAWAVSGDPGWLREHWPQDWASGASYGRGTWTWVFGALPQVVPPLMIPLLAIGAFAAMRSGWPLVLVIVLVMGVHAVLWALAAYGSAGYPRYFVTLAPAYAVLIVGGVEILARLVRAVPPEAWAAGMAGLAALLLLRHPTATVPPPMPPDGRLFAQLGDWILTRDPDPVLHSSHPFAYLRLPSVPPERFDDFGWVREDTLRVAPPGTWVLVEDRLYLQTRRGSEDNPRESELPALGFERVDVPDLGVGLAVADPRHDAAIAHMHWSLWRKPPR